MTTWSVGEDQELIGQTTAMTTLRNWAAQTDLPLPLFFKIAPWDDVVAATEVPAYLAELEGLATRLEEAPPGVAPMLELMLSVARRALRQRLPIVID